MKLYPEATKMFLESGICHTPSSADSYRDTLRHLQSLYPKLELHQFDTRVLTEYCNVNDPSPNTIRTRRGRIRSFFDWAKYTGLITENPSLDLKFTVRPKGGGVREHTWLTEVEFKQMIDACPANLWGQRTRVVLLLGIMTGLRSFEMPQVRWSDLSADLSRLTLVGKGNKMSTIGVPPQLRQALAEWRAQAPAEAVFVIPHMGSDVPRGEADWSRALGKKGLAKLVKEHAERCGLHVRTHDLRRSFAGLLDRKGMPVQDIQKMMRHENLGTTSVYLDKNPARAAALADQFEVAL